MIVYLFLRKGLSKVIAIMIIMEIQHPKTYKNKLGKEPKNPFLLAINRNGKFSNNKVKNPIKPTLTICFLFCIYSKITKIHEIQIAFFGKSLKSYTHNIKMLRV